VRGSQNKEIRSNWSSTWKTISPLLEKMLNASLHKSIVHRHLRRGCNIQSGQSCFDLGYSNDNLTRITWAWVLGITWGLGCKFRCGGDSDGVCDNNANRRPRFSPACFVGEFCEELKWRSSFHKKDSFPSWATQRKERHGPVYPGQYRR